MPKMKARQRFTKRDDMRKPIHLMPRLALVGLLALAAAIAVALLPGYLLRLDIGGHDARRLAPVDRARAVNDVRATLLQGLSRSPEVLPITRVSDQGLPVKVTDRTSEQVLSRRAAAGRRLPHMAAAPGQQRGTDHRALHPRRRAAWR